MTVQITPIVSVATKKDLLEFKVRSTEKWILQDIRRIVKRWCENKGIKMEEGW